MTSNNDNLLKELIETENSHDVEKVLSLLADDIVFEDVTFGVVMKGKDGFKQIYPTFITAAPDFKLEPKSWVTDDKSFSIAGLWVSSCFIDPSHVVFSLNRKKSKRGAMKCKRKTIMNYSLCSMMLTAHEPTSIHNRPESKSSILLACNKISYHHVSRQYHN